MKLDGEGKAKQEYLAERWLFRKMITSARTVLKIYFSINGGPGMPTLIELKEPFWLQRNSHCSIINRDHDGEPFRHIAQDGATIGGRD